MSPSLDLLRVRSLQAELTGTRNFIELGRREWGIVVSESVGLVRVSHLARLVTGVVSIHEASVGNEERFMGMVVFALAG